MTVTWRGRMSQNETGLWVRQQSDLLAVEVKSSRFRKGLLWGGRKKTIRDNAGNAIGQIRVSDFGNSEHEYKDHQDAVARPNPVSVTQAAARQSMEEGDLIARLRKTAVPMDQASTEFQAARLALSQLPDDPVVQARWREAKKTMSASRQLWRLTERGKK